MIADSTNSLFIFVSAVLTANTCRILYKDKMVRGVSLMSQAFFLFWTIWSLYFYGQLQQWVSLVGEFLLMSVMVVYVSMIIFYKRREKNVETN